MGNQEHGIALGDGEVLEVDPPKRLVHTIPPCGATM